MSASQPFTHRAVDDAAAWSALVMELGEGRRTLSGLWGEPGAVSMALLGARAIEVATLACPGGSFPSVGRHHPPAQRLERAIFDLFGLRPEDAPDERPWLDHGRWPIRHPLGAGEAHGGQRDLYEFLPAEGHGLHQIPVGPVHAGIIEPGHFRFTAGGETVVRLEERLGYVHKGVERLMAGKRPAEAARISGRLSGDSTVAYAIAFARAAVSAWVIEAPPRAH